MDTVFSPSHATYVLTLLDGSVTYADTLSIPASERQHNAVEDVFRCAQAQIHRRLHAHGDQHSH